MGNSTDGVFCFQMWLMLGQLEESQGAVDAARTAYTKGCRRCHACVPLWTAAATLEQRCGVPAKSRAILEQARTRVPKNEWLWLAAVRQELAADPSGVDPDAIKAADALLAKGLQECPGSGALWAQAVKAAPRPQRKAKSVDALKRCEQSPSHTQIPNHHPITTRLLTNPPILSTDATTIRGSSRPSPRSSRPIARLTRLGRGSTARARWTLTSATTGRRTTASRRSTAATKWRRRWLKDVNRLSPSTASCGSA